MLRRTLPSLRTLLAVTFGAVALLAAASTALLGGTEAARRITIREVAGMDGLARQFASVLAQGMTSHLDLLRAAAALPAIRNAAATPAERRAVLQVLRQTFPDFTRLALLAPDGQVLADTSPDALGRTPSRPACWPAAMTARPCPTCTTCPRRPAPNRRAPSTWPGRCAARKANRRASSSRCCPGTGHRRRPTPSTPPCVTPGRSS